MRPLIVLLCLICLAAFVATADAGTCKSCQAAQAQVLVLELPVVYGIDKMTSQENTTLCTNAAPARRSVGIVRKVAVGLRDALATVADRKPIRKAVKRIAEVRPVRTAIAGTGRLIFHRR